MKDWLGNDITIGDVVVYSSTSTLQGMNLGEIVSLRDDRIQIGLWYVTKHSWSKGNIITLHQGTSAFKSVTRYFGRIPEVANE